MATTRLTRTSGTPTNNSKWTISVWLKRTALGSDGFIMDAYVSANDRFKFAFQSADKLEIWNSNGGSDDATLTPNRTFKDTSAWYHLLLSMDATLSTATDRFKLYVNGVRETDFGTNVNAPQNSTEFVVNQNGATLAIGAYHGGSTFFDGCMSHFHFVDGTAYDPSTFGETDSTTGEWKINASPTVTYGNNGFFLFKDNASVTDQSGNSNNFTVAAGTLLATEDNPSNNFPVLNRDIPATPPTSAIGGALQITKTNSGYKPGLATMGAFSGKYYAEFKLETASGYTNFGVVNVFKKARVGTGDSLDYIGDGDDGVAYQPGSSSLYYNGSSSGSYGTAAQGDIIGIALDIDNGYVYWSKNGTFLNSGVPTSGGSGTGGFALSNLESTLGNFYVFGVSLAGTSGTRTISCNFGQGFFGTTAVASAGSNASGHGVFEYDVPAGYTAMCTKGLNE